MPNVVQNFTDGATSGKVTLSYTAEYDIVTNQTRVSIISCEFNYNTRGQYQSRHSALVTIYAADDRANTRQAYFSGSYAVTTGSANVIYYVYFKVDPSLEAPYGKDFVIQHTGTPSTDKRIIFDISSVIFSATDVNHAQNPYSASSQYTIAGEYTVPTYSLAISASGGAAVTVTRTSSPLGGRSIGIIGNGEILAYGDILVFTSSTSQITLNGVKVASGYSVTVTAGITVVAELLGSVSILTNGQFSLYSIYIYESGQFIRYAPYIYESGQWVLQT